MTETQAKPKVPASGGVPRHVPRLVEETLEREKRKMFDYGGRVWNDDGDPHPRLVLTVKEVARLLETSSNAIYGAIARGEFPHIRIGKSIRISRAALDRFLAGTGKEPAATNAGNRHRSAVLEELL
jgi:excisionase family DNA binding protein